MCVVKMDRLSVAEAESLMAAMWRALEEYGIRSPQLRVRQSRGLLDLRIEFCSRKDSELMRRVLPCLAAAAAED
jgi:hypothetical protein